MKYQDNQRTYDVLYDGEGMDNILDQLIGMLLNEYGNIDRYRFGSMPKRAILRELMNIRKPMEISSEFLELQNKWLQYDARKKGNVDLSMLPTVNEQFGNSDPVGDKISLWQGDITRLAVDAIVNATNNQMLGCFHPNHACIDNAIHSAAGLQLRSACYDYMKDKRSKELNYVQPVGKAMITEAYNLPSKRVIHVVGPIVYGHLNQEHEDLLRQTYESVLEEAMNDGIKSLAICCISTGEYRFPSERAAEIAVETVVNRIKNNMDAFDRIIFNVFKDSDKEIYKKVLSKL